MSGRPIVSVFDYTTANTVAGQVRLPAVFNAPLRQDIVSFVHDNLSKNSRQARGINFFAGMKHSSLSWGTGRAVSRIPRIRGSGTHRSGQGANGNMCRAGRMFAPLRVWRRWHRKVNLRQRRHALAAAISSSAVTPLVMARGHAVQGVPQLPLVFSEEFATVAQTRDVAAAFSRYGVDADIERVAAARTIRAGKGKLRNRRWKNRRGPLVIGDDNSQALGRAVRNLPGVDYINVNRLNIRVLAPGGHLGRFCIWTQGALQALTAQFGGFAGEAAGRRNYHLENAVISQADIAQIINSNDIQVALAPAKQQPRRQRTTKKNPLKNRSLMARLNPYSAVLAEARQTQDGPKKAISKAQRTEIRNRSRAQLRAALSRVSDSVQANYEQYREFAAETMI